MIPELDENQERILNTNVELVIACPGAGKTRSLVARYMSGRDNPWMGKALLSFTNRAVDEVRDRCSSSPELLTTPNFVGTFDSFVQRFIVNPWYVWRYNTQPTYIDTYRNAYNLDTMVRLAPGPGVGIWNFFIDGPRSVKLRHDSLSHQERQYIKTNALAVPAVETAAYQKLRSLMYGSAVLDCEAARWLAASILATDRGERLLQRLSIRFSELIIDESQDCDKAEIGILKKLREKGLRVVVVTDPDQAIYGFRNAHPMALNEYRNLISNDDILELEINYRSSPTICRLVQSLRSAGAVTPATGNELGAPEVVYVIDGHNNTEKRQKFVTICEDHGAPLDETMVLAHTWAAARSMAGDGRPRHTPTSLTDRLLDSVSIARSRTTPLVARTAAVRTIEMLALELFDWRDLRPKYGIDHRLELLGKDREWLNFVRAGLISSICESVEPAQLVTSLRAFIAEEFSALPVRLRSVGQVVRSPSDLAWDAFEGSSGPLALLQCSTIHGAKGGEWDAVWFDMASHSRDIEGLSDWIDSRPSESVRKLYVGVSRAKRVLALSQSQTGAFTVASALAHKGIPFVVV